MATSVKEGEEKDMILTDKEGKEKEMTLTDKEGKEKEITRTDKAWWGRIWKAKKKIKKEKYPSKKDNRKCKKTESKSKSKDPSLKKSKSDFQPEVFSPFLRTNEVLYCICSVSLMFLLVSIIQENDNENESKIADLSFSPATLNVTTNMAQDVNGKLTDDSSTDQSSINLST